MILFDGKSIKVTDPDVVSNLKKSYFGEYRNKELFLDPEEAIYLMELRNMRCTDNEGNEIGINELSKKFISRKFIARYLVYRDWRERGLVVRNIRYDKKYDKSPVKKYPSMRFSMEKVNYRATLFPDDGISIIDDPSSVNLYKEHWIGQYGSYKAHHRGKLLKLDQYETLFLAKNFGLRVECEREISVDELTEILKRENKDFLPMYDVYEDWRMRGYILKSGFKFGTHFRIYFPGAKPGLKEEHVHSKHVLHVFPKNKKMIIAEWARAIRVAHSVRKTFLLAIPGKEKEKKKKLDFLVYHRKNSTVLNPDNSDPSYAVLALSENETIGGFELAEAIDAASDIGLDLLLAISDRESSITYYHVKRIELPESKYQYYEIEWLQP
jgi:tRNA-intron endonuclease